MTILPIETRYRGYRFRSRLEARWAVFFDVMGIQYLYEHQGFDINGRWYLPDFYLPEFSTYAEVKPKRFTREEYDLAAALGCLLLDGVPEVRYYALAHRCGEVVPGVLPVPGQRHEADGPVPALLGWGGLWPGEFRVVGRQGAPVVQLRGRVGVLRVPDVRSRG